MANFWDRHSEADRVQFAMFLQPLVIASREKSFTKAEASVYLLTLQDVPRDILALGVTKLLQDGVTWMPKPGDIKSACRAVIEAKRLEAGRQAAALLEDCPDCHGSGWREADGGVVRCTCHKRARALMDGMPEPLALPPSNDPEAA